MFLEKTNPMARTKMKPNKSVAKRFKVTKTGKVKRHHGFTSHLMSSRPAKRRRKLRKPELVAEEHARRYRGLMGVSRISPGKVAARAAKARRERAEQAATAGQETAAAATAPR